MAKQATRSLHRWANALSLVLAFALLLGAQVEAAPPPPGDIDGRSASAGPAALLTVPGRLMPLYHPVAVEETSSSVAQRYGLSEGDLRRWNRMDAGAPLVPGIRLLLFVPHSAPISPILPAGPLRGIELLPWPARQGDTVVLRLRVARGTAVSAAFADREVPLQPEGDEQWALLGVPAMAAPGMYALTVRVGDIEVQSALLVIDGGFETYDLELSAETSKLLDPALVQAESARVLAVFGGPATPRAWQARWQPPIEASQIRVTSEFGERRSYNGRPARSYHEGIDFGAPAGTPAHAPADGTVVLAEKLTVRGNGVIVDHGLGVMSGFWHLSKILVQPGDHVTAGQIVGEVGTTGLSTGNHLHWEVRLRGTAVSPWVWTAGDIPEGMRASVDVP